MTVAITKPGHDFQIPCPVPGCDWYVQCRQDSGVGEKAARLLDEHLAVKHGLSD